MPSSTHPVVQELHSLPPDVGPEDIEEIIEFADLKWLGEGATRRVYSLGDGTVLKVVLKHEFASQNKSEVEIFQCTGPDYLAAVIDYDSRQFLWLVMEEANTSIYALRQTLKKNFGGGIKDLSTVAKAIKVGMIDKVYNAIEKTGMLPAEKQKAKTWVDGFKEVVLDKCHVNVDDFRSANVGVRKTTKEIIAIDYADISLAYKYMDESLKLSGLLFESWAQHPLLAQVKAAPTYGDLVELTKTREFKMAFIGKGLTRWVYDLGDAVLKIEMPHSDTQNESEVSVFQCSGPEFFAEIYDYDRENYGWLVMEKLNTNRQDIQRKLASYFGEDTYYLHIEELVGEIHANLLPNIYERIETHAASEDLKKEAVSWVKHFAETIKRCDIDVVDFHKGNVGLRRSTDTIVFLDYASYPVAGAGSDYVDEALSLPETDLLSKVKAAKTRKELLALTETPEFERRYLGAGSTRMVYDLGGGKVLKIEKLHSDTQNKSEVEVFKCTGPKYFAEIYEYDQANFWWLVMEKIDTDRKKTRKKLVSYFGPASRYQFIEKLAEVLSAEGGLEDVLFAIEANRVITSQTAKEAIAWVTNFAAAVKACNVDVVDFHEGNVGTRPSTNQLVFHDYANYDLVNTTSSDALSLSEILFSS